MKAMTVDLNNGTTTHLALHHGWDNLKLLTEHLLWRPAGAGEEAPGVPLGADAQRLSHGLWQPPPEGLREEDFEAAGH